MNEFLEILLVDDDALVRQVLRQVLKNYYPQCQISEAESVDSALAQVDERRWDLIILDLGLGEKSGLSVIHKVNVQNLNIPILVLSAQKNQDAAIPAFRAGARGFISKNEAVGSHQLNQAIEKVLAGGKYVSEGLAAQLVDAMDIEQDNSDAALSAQEHKVLFHIASGKAIKEIAHLMNVSEKTVRTYRSRISQKLNIKTDAEIVRYAIQARIIG